MTKIRRALYMVSVVLPPGMSTDQGGRELHSSICFGQPDVTFMKYLPPREEDQPDRDAEHPGSR